MMKSLFKIDFVTKSILVVYVIYSIALLIKEPAFLAPEYILSFVLGLFSIVVVFRLTSLVSSFSLNFRFITVFSVTLFYILGTVYRYRSGSNFDFALFIDNVREIIYLESTATVLEIFNFYDTTVMLFASLFLLLAQILRKKLSHVEVGSFLWIQIPVLFVVYGAIVVGPWRAGDSLTSFLQGAFAYYRYNPEPSYKYVELEQSDRFPLKVEMERVNPKVQPNIILVAMESFNAGFIGKKTPEGKFVTPFFNSLIDQGYFVSRFYGGSIQTGKGHFCILCSLIPLSQGKVLTDHDDKNLKCLPNVLKEFGYSTIFFQGNKRINFDNSYTFMKNNGIDLFVTPDTSIYPEKLVSEIKWGWGLQDNYLYEQALGRMDLSLKKEKKPVFMMIATISNHMRFNRVPDEQKILYASDGGDLKKRFENSLRLSDEYLKSFFRELKKKPYYKDTLVIITSDHSFPAGEHNSYYPESAAFEESFRIPLLLLWPGKLPVFREDEHAFSQLDIAPTILDILGAQTSNHFLGKSIFQTGEQRRQYMVQPYDGIYQVLVQFPYKYSFHVATGREQLFDLSQDPHEVKNLATNPIYNSILMSFREERSLFWLNDKLIKENRVID